MENFITEEMKLSVKQGINWLDKNHSGWEHRIELSKLDMAKCSSCVIGQAVGNYYDAMREIVNNNEHINEEDSAASDSLVDWAREHGFEAPYMPYTDSLHYYSQLDTLWSNEVRDRLGIGE